jgi:hypothetical protein
LARTSRTLRSGRRWATAASSEARAVTGSWRALEDRLALVSDDELAVVAIGAVQLLGGAGEPLLELLDEALGGLREAQFPAVGGHLRLTLCRGEQLFAVVGIALRADDEHVAGLQLTREVSEDADDWKKNAVGLRCWSRAKFTNALTRLRLT